MSFTTPIALSALNGTTGFRLNGVAADDFSGWFVASAGDVNGDGFADVIVSAYQADPNGNSEAGSSYVVFGKASGWSSTLALSSLNGTTGFRLDGVTADDQSGISVSSAGDVNGDGFADLIVGAYQADPNGNQSGSSYVVFGRAGGWSSTMALSSLDGTTGFRLDGAAAFDESGRAVASAGDVNGDGFADLIVGAYWANPNGNNDAGYSHVVFGRASGWSSTVALSGLDGTDGFRLDGAAADDRSGWSVASAGDVNGDGFGDLIVGAYQANPNGNSDAGASYVVFGRASGWNSTLALSTLNGTNGFRLDGAAAFDESGQSVASAGDLNGDGFADLIVGAYRADPNGPNSGSSYVVFGKASGWSSTVALSGLNGTTGFRLDGALDFDRSGISVASAGDVNGDGRADLIVGAYQADPLGISNAGSSYVYFSPGTGGATYRGTTLDDRLRGTPNADTLQGNAGDDTLDGGAGNDSINGDAGNDTASYISAGAGVMVSLAAVGAQNSFGAGTDTLTSMENLRGSNFADSLTGSGADNTIEGGAGNDTMNGGGGNDTASFAHAAAGVTYGLLSQGSLFNTVGAGTDTLSSFENLLGSGFNDVLGGDLGANTLWGGAGDDRLFAWGGNDSVNGGDGNDTLYGSGSGTDTLSGGAGANIFQVNAIGTVVNATGADNAFVTVNGWTAASGLIATYLAGSASQLSGGAGNDALVANNAVGSQLSGGGGNDTLYGGTSGADTLAGGTGVNLYQVNAVGTVITATGTDLTFVTVNGWTASAGATANYLSGSATQMLGSTSADVLVANSTADSTLSGGDGNDTLWGQGFDDTLQGQGGNDLLRGGAGNDVLTGGAGNDQLMGGAWADQFNFTSAAEGYDQVFDFSRAEGDQIRIAYAGGPASFAALTVYEIGPHTVVQFGTTRIDIYGVTGMAAGDFLFV